MMISPKEQKLLVFTVIFILFMVLLMPLRKRIDELKELRSEWDGRVSILNDYQKLIHQKNLWDESYKNKASLMPVFGMNRQVETYWLATLDRIASTNNLSIIRRQAGPERLSGDVYEMSLECKEWEGSLESLISFLYDIHAEGAMLDIRRLTMRPGPAKSKLLRGSFVLCCAYMRSPNIVDSQPPTLPPPPPSKNSSSLSTNFSSPNNPTPPQP